MRAWLQQVQRKRKGKKIEDNKYRELYQKAIVERDVGFLNRRYEF